jgi:hypothetical protein
LWALLSSNGRALCCHVNDRGRGLEPIQLGSERQAFRFVEELAVADIYSALVMSKGPIAYWRLRDGAGATMAADETGSHDGQYLGPTPLGSTAGVIAGTTAAAFDGRNYVEVSNSAEFSMPTHFPQGMTVEAWMRPDELNFPPEYIHWLGKGRSNQEEWALRFYRNESNRPNRISGYLFRPTAVHPRETNKGAGAYFQRGVARGEWLHVVVTYEPGNSKTYYDPQDEHLPSEKRRKFVPGVRIYRNGVLEQGPPSLATLYCHPEYLVDPVAGTQQLRIGGRDIEHGPPYFQGGLAEIAIYRSVLSARDIQDHYETARSLM